MNAFYLLVALQVADIVSTLVALKNPKLREANPILLKLFDKIGVAPTLVGMKAIFVGFLWWAHPYVYESILWGLCVFYVFVVANNIKLIREHS